MFRTTNGGATYDQVAKLTAADAAEFDAFGASVAIDGDTIVVGTSRAEAVYVFRTTDGGATYAQVAKLTASDAAANHNFGISVAIAGNTIVVGANGAGTGGAVYVFRTTDGGATYSQVAKLTAADAAEYDQFGISVAIDGSTIVVGAYNEYDPDLGYYGSAYVFRTSDGGASYVEVAKLTADDAAMGYAERDYFGTSVAVDGSTVVVGACKKDWRGAVYVFHTTDGWATHVEIKLTAADAATYDNFGYSVAIDGTTVVVSADWKGGPGN